MKKRLISIGITCSLIFTLFFIWYMISSNYFLGSYFKVRSEQELIVTEMMEKLKIQDYTLENIYHLNETVYVVIADYKGNASLLWFDEQCNLLAVREQSSYLEDNLQMKAEEMNLENYTISLGFFKDKPMVVFNTDQQEILLDYDTLAVTLTYFKKVVY